MENTTTTAKYVEVDPSAIPPHVAWCTPREHQGQIVEVSYADERPQPDPAARGSKYKRVIDWSSMEYWFYVLREA